MEEKKYVLTEESKEVDGHILHRIKALKDFTCHDREVHKEDLGGWIEKEENLSHEGNCWIFDNACVYDNACVFGNAFVCDTTRVYDNACVFGNALVFDNTRVFGNAWVYDKAQMFEDSQVCSTTKVCDNTNLLNNDNMNFEDSYRPLPTYNVTLTNILKHYKTICIHKFWVLIFCCKCGIPFQGIIHDMSKFSPTEFFESVKYYTGKESPIDICKREHGYSNAWLHHKGRNKHHYEYWQDNFDNGTTHVAMPYKYAVEMLCDYLAAGRTYIGKSFTYNNELDWWIQKRKTANAMDDVTKSFITDVINRLSLYGDIVLNPSTLKSIYDEKR